MALPSSELAPLSNNAFQVPGPRWSHPVAMFVIRRVAAGLLTLLAASIVIFLAASVLPGNAAVVVLGRAAQPATVRALESRLGLDHSLPHRYLAWLWSMLHGNFGDSAVAVAEGRAQTSISATLGEPFLHSAVLALVTTALLIPLTLFFGALAGMHAGRRLDHAISVPSLVFGGLPEFVSGTGLIYLFFTVLGVLPPVALLSPGTSTSGLVKQMVLPVLTLLAVALGAGIRQVRSGMIETLEEQFVHYARMNGIRERRVLVRYALRNALAPSVQTIAQNLQYLVGGIIIVESIFAYPGIGTYLVDAVTTRDVTEVQAASLILATVYIVINIVADLIVVLMVPRLRTAL